MRVRRHVTLVVDAHKAPRARTVLYGYDQKALAKLVGKSVDTVQRDIKAGLLDPADLWSVFSWAQGRWKADAQKRRRRRRRKPAEDQSSAGAETMPAT